MNKKEEIKVLRTEMASIFKDYGKIVGEAVSIAYGVGVPDNEEAAKLQRECVEVYDEFISKLEKGMSLAREMASKEDTSGERLRIKIDKMLEEHNIRYDKEHSHYQDDALIYYEDDQYSGKRIVNRIDECGYLFQRIEDDSPEQCGGWRVMYLYKDGNTYCLNNIADKWSYFVKDDVVYLCLADETLMHESHYQVSIIKVLNNEEAETWVHKDFIDGPVFDSFDFVTLREFCLCQVNKLNESETESEEDISHLLDDWK